MKIRWLKKKFVGGRLGASNNCCKGVSGLGLITLGLCQGRLYKGLSGFNKWYFLALLLRVLQEFGVDGTRLLGLFGVRVCRVSINEACVTPHLRLRGLAKLDAEHFSHLCLAKDKARRLQVFHAERLQESDIAAMMVSRSPKPLTGKT